MKLSHVIFDMDGTLSWLRHGWPQLMIELIRPHYPAPEGQSELEARDYLLTEMLSLNGLPTIHQMILFEKIVKERGGTCPAPEALRREYQNRLDTIIAGRVGRLRSGASKPDDYVLFGARPLLDKLDRLGLTLVILSGTLESRVKEEAKLLDISDYFGRHIYGSTPDPENFSKRKVIERILREEGITGKNVLAFGDGPVEIAETKRIGGMAIGVASDEEKNGSGIMDHWKEDILRKAGADALIPDFREPDKIIGMIADRS